MKVIKQLKILKPSLRERKRYISFKVISEEPISYPELESVFWETILEFLGEHGVSRTSVWLVKNLYREKEQIGVIRCNHTSVIPIIACLGLISRLGDKRVVIKVLKVSGTIKGLKLK